MSANDPVSEFLAREQSALADLGEDFNNQPIEMQAPQVEENGFGPLTNGTSGLNGTVENMALNAPFTDNDAFMDMDGVQGTRMNTHRVSPTLSGNSRSQSIQPEEEPEKIRKWREQQKESIAKKDKEEEKKKEELRQQAKKELEQFYAQRNAQLEQRKKQNRDRQATVVGMANMKTEEKDMSLSPVMWERVARMIEGIPVGGGAGGCIAKVPKPAGQSSALGKDTSRMKQLIMLYARGENNDKSPSPEPGLKA